MGMHFYLDEEKEISLSESEKQYGDLKFQLHADLYLWSKSKETAIGPAVHWYLPIDEDGQMRTSAMHHDRNLSEDMVGYFKSLQIPGVLKSGGTSRKLVSSCKPIEHLE